MQHQQSEPPIGGPYYWKALCEWKQKTVVKHKMLVLNLVRAIGCYLQKLKLHKAAISSAPPISLLMRANYLHELNITYAKLSA